MDGSDDDTRQETYDSKKRPQFLVVYGCLNRMTRVWMGQMTIPAKKTGPTCRGLTSRVSDRSPLSSSSTSTRRQPSGEWYTILHTLSHIHTVSNSDTLIFHSHCITLTLIFHSHCLTLSHTCYISFTLSHTHTYIFHTHSAEEVSSMILTKMKETAETYLGGAVHSKLTRP